MFEQPVIVEESYGGVAADYVPSIFDDSEVVYVDSPVNSISLIFSSDSFNDYGEEPIILEFYPTAFEDNYDEDFVVAPIEETTMETIEENIVYEDHVLYTSSLEEKDDAPLRIFKAPKAKANKNKSVRSNQAVVETSLIVVGAVDLLSVVLIKRRKHLFR